MIDSMSRAEGLENDGRPSINSSCVVFTKISRRKLMPGVGEELGEPDGFCCAGTPDERVNGLWLDGDGKQLVFEVATELIDPPLPAEEAVGGRGVL